MFLIRVCLIYILDFFSVEIGFLFEGTPVSFYPFALSLPLFHLNTEKAEWGD